MINFLRQFLIFGIQNALSCLFPVIVFGLLAASHLFSDFIARYDFIFIACILIQWLLYILKMETKDELIVIGVFHLLGLALEIFKVNIGAWSYPEYAYFKVWNVPLYSGFMYASVASYLCQAWRRFDLKMMDWPSTWPVRIIGVLIYLNFFSNYFLPDIRYYIAVLIVFWFRKSWVVFQIEEKAYKMPVILSFLLIGFFIWLAENIATFLGAWQYTYQHTGWVIVNYQKISSWMFLIIVSYIIVAELKMVKRHSNTRF